MKVRVAYTLEISDDYRRAINVFYGKPGMATRADVVNWLREYGSSQNDDLMYDLEQAEKRGEA